MKRRAFLALLAGAPIAALVPWRPPAAPVNRIVRSYLRSLPRDSSSLWCIQWDEHTVMQIACACDLCVAAPEKTVRVKVLQPARQVRITSLP